MTCFFDLISEQKPFWGIIGRKWGREPNLGSAGHLHSDGDRTGAKRGENATTRKVPGRLERCASQQGMCKARGRRNEVKTKVPPLRQGKKKKRPRSPPAMQFSGCRSKRSRHRGQGIKRVGRWGGDLSFMCKCFSSASKLVSYHHKSNPTNRTSFTPCVLFLEWLTPPCSEHPRRPIPPPPFPRAGRPVGSWAGGDGLLREGVGPVVLGRAAREGLVGVGVNPHHRPKHPRKENSFGTFWRRRNCDVKIDATGSTGKPGWGGSTPHPALCRGLGTRGQPRPS